MSLARRASLFIVGLALLSGTGREAAAHALVVESMPAVEGGVRGPEIEISVRFNSRLDHRRSTLTLIAADGTNRRLTISAASAPDMLQATASDLVPGAYKLRWQVLAIDGHITRGDIPFHVTPP
jgi:copper resistance protein C